MGHEQEDQRTNVLFNLTQEQLGRSRSLPLRVGTATHLPPGEPLMSHVWKAGSV